jgi:hypothetical protein
MLARLRAWKAKEVQERAQQKNLFFVEILLKRSKVGLRSSQNQI